MSWNGMELCSITRWPSFCWNWEQNFCTIIQLWFGIRGSSIGSKPVMTIVFLKTVGVWFSGREMISC